MQLVLPVGFRKQDGFDTFIDTGNEQLVSHLKSLDTLKDVFPSPSQRISVITGHEASGKTHLLLASCEQAAKQNLKHQYLDLNSLQGMPSQMMSDLLEASHPELICIDNLQAIAAKREWQVALFDVINKFIENNQRLLLISSCLPLADLKYELPDLKTRLTWGTNFVITELNDNDKLKAIALQLQTLGMDSSQEIVSFLYSRTSRDMHQLSQCIEKLDKASLQSKRKLTIPFMKSVLSI